jgi:hypothetical protein
MTVSKKIWERLALITILVITALVYRDIFSSPSLGWDDPSNIFNNPLYKFHVWWWVWKEPYFGLYVPVTSTIWYALLKIGDGSAWPFRILNIVLHLSNTVLVFRLLDIFRERLGITQRWFLLLGVALFALHPLQVESVAWISAGRDLLAAFFALLAAIFYFKNKNYWLTTAFFILALLSKPNVVVLPVALLILDWAFFERDWRRSSLRLLPWLGLSVIVTAMTQIGQGPHFQNLANWWQRPILMFDSFAFYFLKTFWPDPLAVNYAHTPEVLFARSHWWLPALIAFLVMSAIALWIILKDRPLSVLSWWAVFLFPISGIVPFAYENIGGVADHYNYLPLVAVSAGIMILCARLSHKNLQAGVLALLLSAVAVLSHLSWRRIEVWFSDRNLYFDMAISAPGTFTTAIGMSAVLCQEKGGYEAGADWAMRALQINRNDILGLANLAACHNRAGFWDRTDAMSKFLSELDDKGLREKAPTAYSNFLSQLGQAAIMQKRYKEGFEKICEAYRILPSNPEHLQNLKAAAEILGKVSVTATCQ